MIAIKNTVLPSADQWKAAISGCRNPMNSWDKSDSNFCKKGDCIDCELEFDCKSPGLDFTIGPNDYNLMKNLCNAGTDHRKFMRMITVYADITAALYWWKEFDTYKVGTVANSCSTMHKIHEKEFTLKDFSCEHLYAADDIDGMYYSTTAEEEFTSVDVLEVVIEALNRHRKMYLATQDKKDWWQMIQLLPSSYNQRRTVMLNYEVLTNMYKNRRHHKLDEWREFCKWIGSLPYSELIIGSSEMCVEKENEQ